MASVNNTLVVLILKKENPISLMDFRPISLCRVIYKIITKVIVNRLKPSLPSLICLTHTSFIPGRHISENIIIAQEAIYYLRNKKGKKKFMAIKIDLTKAYDMLGWDFINDTLLDVGIPDNIIKVIVDCVSSSIMEILWNREQTSTFTPTRGIC